MKNKKKNNLPKSLIWGASLSAASLLLVTLAILLAVANPGLRDQNNQPAVHLFGTYFLHPAILIIMAPSLVFSFLGVKSGAQHKKDFPDDADRVDKLMILCSLGLFAGGIALALIALLVIFIILFMVSWRS